tara:strand:- start:26 stop:217 length:192 start_codon:yes stop_codon:yes gene_type:complete
MSDHEIDLFIEGGPCPFCDNEEGDYYIDSEGGVNDDYQKHNYYCPECEKEWFNYSQFKTYEVK